MKAARESLVAEDWALAELETAAGWFEDHLAAPEVQFRGARHRDAERPLSWFKATAADHIRKMHDLRRALEGCGLLVDLITTDDPGLILWEDEHQIVAEAGNRRF